MYFIDKFKDSNIFEKMYFFYFFQDDMDNWNIAFIRNLHLLINNQFIQTNNLNTYSNSQPKLCLFTNLQTDDIKDNLFFEILDPLNKYVE
jgi:hypothetical protein